MAAFVQVIYLIILEVLQVFRITAEGTYSWAWSMPPCSCIIMHSSALRPSPSGLPFGATFPTQTIQQSEIVCDNKNKQDAIFHQLQLYWNLSYMYNMMRVILTSSFAKTHDRKHCCCYYYSYYDGGYNQYNGQSRWFRALQFSWYSRAFDGRIIANSLQRKEENIIIYRYKIV